jgi:hypothetical protein
VGLHPGDARVTHVALLGEKLLVEHLQLQGAPQQDDREQREQADQQPGAQPDSVARRVESGAQIPPGAPRRDSPSSERGA